MRAVFAVLAMNLALTPAFADEAEEMFFATEMGQVVSAAEVCGYNVNTEALKSIMAGKVAELGSSAKMAYYVNAENYPDQLAAMSQTARSASCALQEALARKHGLLP